MIQQIAQVVDCTRLTTYPADSRPIIAEGGRDHLAENFDRRHALAQHL